MNDDYMMRKNPRLNVGRDGESERESEKDSEWKIENDRSKEWKIVKNPTFRSLHEIERWKKRKTSNISFECFDDLIVKNKCFLALPSRYFPPKPSYKIEKSSQFYC